MNIFMYTSADATSGARGVERARVTREVQCSSWQSLETCAPPSTCGWTARSPHRRCLQISCQPETKHWVNNLSFEGSSTNKGQCSSWHLAADCHLWFFCWESGLTYQQNKYYLFNLIIYSQVLTYWTT